MLLYLDSHHSFRPYCSYGHAASNTPTLHELFSFPGQEKKINIPQEIGTHYKTFGSILLEDDTGARVDNIVHQHRERAEHINTEILQEWLVGRGKQPVTWATLVEVLHDIELSTLARDISTTKLVGEVMQGRLDVVSPVACYCPLSRHDVIISRDPLSIYYPFTEH